MTLQREHERGALQRQAFAAESQATTLEACVTRRHGACASPSCPVCLASARGRGLDVSRGPPPPGAPPITVSPLGAVQGNGAVLTCAEVSAPRGRSGVLVVGPAERRWLRWLDERFELRGDRRTATRLLGLLAGGPQLDDSVLGSPGRHREWRASASRPPGQARRRAAGGSDCGVNADCAGATTYAGPWGAGLLDPTSLAPSDYRPDDDDGGTALWWMWAPFTTADDNRWLEWEVLEQAIAPDYWNAADTAGADPSPQYPPWHRRPEKYGRLTSYGIDYYYTLYALQLVYTYANTIPESWLPARAEGPVCRGLGRKITDLLESEESFLRVWVNGQPTSRDEGDRCVNFSGDQFTWASMAGIKSYAISDAASGEKNPWRGLGGYRSYVGMCRSYVHGHALAADYFLHHGNRLFWYGLEECATTRDTLEYLDAARYLGRIALGCFAVHTRTLVHELGHYFFTADRAHCDLYCCPQGLAGRHWARLRAYLGLPKVDSEFVDAWFAEDTDTYNSGCEDLETGSRAYEAEFRFDQLGIQGDQMAWTLLSQTYPPPCKPS